MHVQNFISTKNRPTLVRMWYAATALPFAYIIEFEQTKAKVTTAVAVHSLVATCACAIQRFLLLNIILFIVTFVFSPFHSQLTVFLLKVISVLFYLLIKMSSRSLQMCVLSLNICTHIHTHMYMQFFVYVCIRHMCLNKCHCVPPLQLKGHFALPPARDITPAINKRVVGANVIQQINTNTYIRTYACVYECIALSLQNYVYVLVAVAATTLRPQLESV